MAIQLSITNVFRFISYITPVLLIFFMIMISVFNQDVKGLIYLGGVLITIFITVACKNMIKHPSDNPAYTCELFDFPGNASDYTVPSLNSVLIAFTFSYLLKPMQDYNQYNFSIIIAILMLFIIDAVTKLTNNRNVITIATKILFSIVILFTFNYCEKRKAKLWSKT